MTNRRKFLKLLGVGTASAPLATKELINAEELAGLNRHGHFSSDTGIAQAAEDSAYTPNGKVDSIAEAANYLRKVGKLPEHVERRLRDDARNICNLDYDIAIKCWSLSVKIATQRERNYQRNLVRYREGTSYTVAQKAFAATTGFKWPW